MLNRNTILSLCYLLLSSTFFAGQELAESSEGRSALTISKRVDEVSLMLSVTDRNGRFVTDIKREDLQILDNHVPPQKWNYFQPRTDLPLRVILMVDTSSSIRERFRFEQQAANAFLKRVLRPEIDEAGVIAFNSEAREIRALTSDVKKIAEAINQMRPGGETVLYDALLLGAQKLSEKQQSQVLRRVIILITDGVDTQSHASLQAAERAASKSEAVILALDSNIPSEKHSKGAQILQQLALSSGGLVLPAEDKSELKKALQTAEIFLRNQYAVGYAPMDFRRNGNFRPIEVRSTRHGLKVHAREGYFAPLQ
jgi:Ca-activated chloride channel homolog